LAPEQHKAAVDVLMQRSNTTHELQKACN